MTFAQLESTINTAWDRRDQLSDPDGDLSAIKSAVTDAINAIDEGRLRVAEKMDGEWVVHQWAKKAVLLSFRLTPNQIIAGGPGGAPWFDKVPSKFEGWTDAEFAKAGFRAVPTSTVRRGSYIAPGAVLMPSFVNIGAYVGEGTMVDTWVTIGSCAQIGAHCHISGGVGIGGVLEPLQAEPVIIEDNCFIGARSEIAEGVRVGEGAVVSMGVFIGASTKIVDRQTGDVHYGKVPPYSVVVPGTLPSANGGPSLACAVIVKTVDERTRSKTAINDLLRD
ncbi:2,3,4,5-tetrahydropyridine-2,6-dicarboxylate N-succinyltransferase [Parvularcula sp. LCG005]|uniref:2,3,4,5-tetrahydropyridine-2,6-dicarboxylate N-succinyltransferase n=1 Tax=Parvularcula sp. LCG005 TaxID=3078805 RepID=UPI0029425187|nr:2,3,4,5-tetrahydropyridine-2,6-dicarboxylate N-succinyltransferase [Parvularcula sp. LCG005]WOI53169.1 2,3,4,5-tetrahydropyridine-2,6-dicarboxylate N-succinyltransferase [Parvularcula sp. LCG005]